MTITQGVKKGMKKVLESAGGGEKGKPHSTSAGRIAAGARKYRRGAKKVASGAIEGAMGFGRGAKKVASGAIEGAKNIAKPFVKEAVMLEKLKNRAKKRSTWDRKQKYRKEVQKHGGNVIYADEWDKIDPGLKKGIGLKKGGRIRKGHGGSTMQQHYLQHGYGPTKAKLRAGKPKIAKKGWA